MMTRNPAMNCNEMAFFPANFMLQSLNHQQKEHPPTNLSSVLPSSSSPQEFHGVCSLLGRRSLSFSGIDGCEDMNCEDDLSDDCSQAGEKKKRLNMEQVKTLEKNFELGNKLEPERKIQLARALGLQPRQIAIWFQNRRARWKTKKLEKDYDVLKRQFEAVKSDYEALQVQNKKLQAEILILKNRETSEPINLNKETEGSCSNRSENSSEIESRTNRSQANLTQSFQSCSRSDPLCPKIENQIHEESFCNLFGNLEEPTGFWTWTDQSNFH